MLRFQLLLCVFVDYFIDDFRLNAGMSPISKPVLGDRCYPTQAFIEESLVHIFLNKKFLKVNCQRFFVKRQHLKDHHEANYLARKLKDLDV